jgi:hypothetical protein
MSFPRAHEGTVFCNGFPEKYLHALQYAIETKQVKWGKSSLFASNCSAEFEWAGCTWELTEDFEMVSCISLISGTPNEEDLTVAVLRG